MSDMTLNQTVLQTATDAEQEAILTQIFTEISLLQKQMERTEAEINRYKADSARYSAETKSILARLKAMV